jgi:branched-chain amino acid transport system ATP-binding protein
MESHCSVRCTFLSKIAGTSVLLRIANLEVVYNRIARVLNGVSIEVGDAETVALLGPNGAGKSTLLRALTGLLPIHDGDMTKGSITLGDINLLNMPPEKIVRQGVVQVMEGRRIFIDLSVEDNLLAGAYSQRRDVSKELADIYAQFPRLHARRKQLAGYLSGGEQQMLAISRALLTQPKLLLLDEPSLGLSPVMTQEVGRLIRQIQQRGISILLVEQNAAMALNLASRGFVLESGKVVLDGDSRQLLDDPDFKEFYLGQGGGKASTNFRDVKHYRRKRRWLS